MSTDFLDHLGFLLRDRYCRRCGLALDEYGTGTGDGDAPPPESRR